MKAIVCEMCDSTNLVKESGLYVCQECGCKYSVEEAKKLMKEVDEDRSSSSESSPVENTPEIDLDKLLHTPDSPNKLSVKITKMGHEDIRALPPHTYFADGPNQVGGIGPEISLQNIAGKTIKYATIYLTPYNRVGDAVECSIRHTSVGQLEITGPIVAGEKWEGYFDCVWYDSTIMFAKIDLVHIIYTDESQEVYKGEEFYSTSVATDDRSKEQKGTITVHVKPAFTARNVTVTCILSNGESFKVANGESVSVSVDFGKHSITLDFFGKSLVPKKNKFIPEFEVNGNVYIELDFDAIWGGFKSTIVPMGR